MKEQKDMLENVNHPMAAIVLQGPVITENDFTIESLKLYKNLFPSCILIVSTWDTTPKSVLEKMDNLGDIHIVLNTMPNYVGESNINLQILTSKSGIKRAEELGALYAMKTRTDQRMYGSGIVSYFYNLIKLFPLDKSILKQRERLIGVGLNTFKYRMYGISDMLLFGHIKDMLLFWDIPFDQRVFKKEDRDKANSSLKTFAEWRVCEVYLTTEFLKKNEKTLDWTLKDSWETFADHFCIVDKESIDLYWGKYGVEEYRWRDYDKSFNSFEEMNYKAWLNLYMNRDNLCPDESLLNKPIKN